MTKYEVYRLLNRPKDIKQKIALIQEQIEDLEATMLPGAIRYDKDSVMSSPVDPMVTFAERYEPLSNKLAYLKEQYTFSYNQIERLLVGMTPQQEAVIRLKYLKEMSNSEVGKVLGLSKRHVIRICDKTTTKLSKPR